MSSEEYYLTIFHDDDKIDLFQIEPSQIIPIYQR